MATNQQDKLAEQIRIPGRPPPERRAFAAELKKFTDRFGAEAGVRYFLEGLSYTDAQVRFERERQGRDSFTEQMQKRGCQ